MTNFTKSIEVMEVTIKEVRNQMNHLEFALNVMKDEMNKKAVEAAVAPMTERQAVILAAKDFVESRLEAKRPFDGKVAKFKMYAVKPEFHVNKEKRIVTCLLKGASSGHVKSKAFAKAAPMDCFNVHIGKAIAFAKALGERIPNQFFDAPQPTEAEVGDVVEWGSLSKKTSTLTQRIPHFDTKGCGKAFRHTHDGGWLGDKQVKIVDDSKE